MENGLGDPQSVVMFGGTSEIGLAILRRLTGPTTRTLVLASRDTTAAAAAVDRISVGDGTTVEHVAWDASDPACAEDSVRAVAAAAGDIDLAIVAVGVLDEDRDVLDDRSGLANMAAVNFTSPMIVLSALASLMREQGYGRIILLSSVAGVRPRRANPAYGATKSGIDGFALALDHALEGTGVRILVVRPGFVATRMTAGMPPAPFATTPDKIAVAVEKAVSSSSPVLWVPGILRFVFAILRSLPNVLWRRLPL